MRRANNGKLKYLLIGAVLIIAMVGIIRMTVPDREDVKDEHAGQVLINDGFDDIWITPYPNVPVNAMARDEVRLENGLPVYSGTDFDTKIGVDVSEHQWEVDWQAAAQVIDFAYIRLGYRGYTEGGLFLDPWYEKNITGAAAAGLDTGVYFFSQATNVSEAIEEAKYVIEHLRGFRINMPVWSGNMTRQETSALKSISTGKEIRSGGNRDTERSGRNIMKRNRLSLKRGTTRTGNRFP